MTFAEDLLRQRDLCPHCGFKLNHKIKCEICGLARCSFCEQCLTVSSYDLDRKMSQEAEDLPLMEKAMQEADRWTEIGFGRLEFYRELRLEEKGEIPFTKKDSIATR